MSTIERLAELAKGATLALELERYDHGSGRLTTVVKGMRLIVADINGEQDREFYAACNPAAIAQAHAEYAELERRNAELVGALEHIREYWNRDQNETAMADALWHIIETAKAALAHTQETSK